MNGRSKNTTDRVLQFLGMLREIYKDTSRLSLVNICRQHGIPAEYAKWIVADGYLIRDGGQRGPNYCKWNQKKRPTKKYATELRRKYNALRNKENYIRNTKNKKDKETTYDLLLQIREMLTQIMPKSAV